MKHNTGFKWVNHCINWHCVSVFVYDCPTGNCSLRDLRFLWFLFLKPSTKKANALKILSHFDWCIKVTLIASELLRVSLFHIPHSLFHILFSFMVLYTFYSTLVFLFCFIFRFFPHILYWHIFSCSVMPLIVADIPNHLPKLK